MTIDYWLGSGVPFTVKQMTAHALFTFHCFRVRILSLFFVGNWPTNWIMSFEKMLLIFVLYSFTTQKTALCQHTNIYLCRRHHHDDDDDNDGKGNGKWTVTLLLMRIVKCTSANVVHTYTQKDVLLISWHGVHAIDCQCTTHTWEYALMKSMAFLEIK